MNEIPRTNNRSDVFLEVLLLLGFVFFLFFTIIPHNAHAEDRLLLFYSGNVNGEIEGCG